MAGRTAKQSQTITLTEVAQERQQFGNEAEIGEEAYTAIYNSLLELGLLGPTDERFSDAVERLRMH